MKVVHCLPSVRTCVYDASETTGCKAFCSRCLSGDEQQVTQQGHILFFDTLNTGQRFFRYDQNVDRCLGVGVAKRNTAIILVNDISGYFTADDFREDSFTHDGTPPVEWARNAMAVFIRDLHSSRTSEPGPGAGTVLKPRVEYLSRNDPFVVFPPTLPARRFPRPGACAASF